MLPYRADYIFIQYLDAPHFHPLGCTSILTSRWTFHYWLGCWLSHYESFQQLESFAITITSNRDINVYPLKPGLDELHVLSIYLQLGSLILTRHFMTAVCLHTDETISLNSVTIHRPVSIHLDVLPYGIVVEPPYWWLLIDSIVLIVTLWYSTPNEFVPAIKGEWTL